MSALKVFVVSAMLIGIIYFVSTSNLGEDWRKMITSTDDDDEMKISGLAAQDATTCNVHCANVCHDYCNDGDNMKRNWGNCQGKHIDFGVLSAQLITAYKNYNLHCECELQSKHDGRKTKEYRTATKPECRS